MTHWDSLALLALLVPSGVADDPQSPRKVAAVRSVEERARDIESLSDRIWSFAEIALRETRSAAALADYAEARGFEVTRGVAGMPTAFVAAFGSGRPVIAILGEFDALPGLSQKAVPVKAPLEPGAPGHGCGHNLFGPASLGAAAAIRDLIAAGDLRGTVRFYGTPAEESVGGKLYMVREGLFSDVDVAVAWHPSNETRADTQSSQSMVDFVVEFEGKAAHAAFDPWNGRSALDGLEIFTFALNQMREHVRPSVRMHYSILEGGDVPNVVPERARLWCWLRDSKKKDVEALLERAREIARGAAIAAGVEARVVVRSGSYEMLVNMTGARKLHENLEWLGPIPFTDADEEFARALQKATGVEPTGLKRTVEPFDESPGEPEGGSTDVADVSWVVPTLHFSVTTAPRDTPWHAWPVVACAGMSIGHRGMTHAAKAMAAIAVDLFEDEPLRIAIRDEFEKSVGDHVYAGFIPEGPPRRD